MGREDVAVGVEASPEIDFSVSSGNALTDSLLIGTQYRADSNGETWISYSFPDANSNWSSQNYSPSVQGIVGGEPYNNFQAVSENAQRLFEDAFAQLSRLTHLEFVEVPDSGNSAGSIRVAWSRLGESGAYADRPQSTPRGSDIWFNSDILEEHYDRYPYTVFHELGHAIGLKHPFSDSEALTQFPYTPAQYDGINYTLMAYRQHASFHDAYGTTVYPSTYMYLDILALQHLYGKDTESTAGDETYEYDLRNENYLTIWDAGGNDTFKVFSGDATVTKNLRLDLTPGSWSDVGTEVIYGDMKGNITGDSTKDTVFITPETIIENAEGAGGDDQIIGNDADNFLIGNEGNDTISGGKGADTLLGGAGNDALWAGSGDDGADQMDGGVGDDVIGGGAGDDTLIGGEGADTIYGGEGNDTLAAKEWAVSSTLTDEETGNALWAGGGDDLVMGANGADKLGGGLGDDNIMGEGGDDILFGGKSGNDSLDGDAGNDVIYAGNGDDIIWGGAGDDEIYGGSGADSIQGEDGNDTLYGGAGNDTLTGGDGADTFYFGAGHGNDRVDAFDLENDTLDISSTNIDFTMLADVQTAAETATMSGVDGVMVDTGEGDSIFLAGLSLANLSSIEMTF